MTNQNISQFFTIMVDFIHYPVYVSLGNDMKVVATLLGKELGDDPSFIYEMLMGSREEIIHDGGCIMGECFRLVTGEILILISDYPSCADDLVSITHEVAHAVHFIYEMIDTPLCPETTEVYAYLTGYLTEQILNRLQISLKPGVSDRVTVTKQVKPVKKQKKVKPKK